MKRTLLGAACVVALAAGGLVFGGCGSDPITVTIDLPDDPVAPDGKSAAKIEIRVMKGDQAVSGGTLTVSSSLDGTQFNEAIEGTEPPSAEGRSTESTLTAGSASLRLYSNVAGETKIEASYTDENGAVATAVPKKYKFGASSSVVVAGITFVSAEPEVLQLKDSGGQTTSVVTFQVTDSASAPVRGAEIIFELGSELGGASVNPTTARTGDDGKVFTTLTSGTTYGTVKVIALTTDREIRGESNVITVAGSAANHKHFDFTCAKPAIGGLRFNLLTMNCTAAVADRSSQKIANVKVTFETEAGAVDTHATTDENGNATTIHKTQTPYPVDVPPNLAYLPASMQTQGLSEEPSQPCPDNTSKTCNPRDGLVTLIAVTAGEEEWTDSNENGVWDDGEKFVDLPEPYVDANDNGRFDANDLRESDLYIDANENGSWDDKNYQWDGSTQIWRATRIVWTGAPDPSQSKFYTATHAEISTAASSTDTIIGHCQQKEFSLLMVDKNLNRIVSHDGDAITCICAPKGLCTVYPDTLSLGDGGGGKHYYSIQVADPHLCEDDPSRGTDNLSCTGSFSQDAEGTEAAITYMTSMSVSVDY